MCFRGDSYRSWHSTLHVRKVKLYTFGFNSFFFFHSNEKVRDLCAEHSCRHADFIGLALCVVVEVAFAGCQARSSNELTLMGPESHLSALFLVGQNLASFPHMESDAMTLFSHPFVIALISASAFSSWATPPRYPRPAFVR